MADDTKRGTGDDRDESGQIVAQRADPESQGPGTATRNGRAADVGGQRRRTGRSVDTDSKTEQAVAEKPERQERAKAEPAEKTEPRPAEARPPSAPETKVD